MDSDTGGVIDQPVIAQGAEPPVPPRRGRAIGMALAGFLVVVAVIGGVVIPRLLGSPESAASRLPAATQLYIGVDLLRATSDDSARVVERIVDLVAAVDGTDDDRSLREIIDEELRRETGFSLDDDIVPWVGRSAAVGVWGVAADMASPDLDPPNMVLVVDVRDAGRADAFLTRLADYLADQGSTVTVFAVGEHSLTRVTDEWGEEWVFGRVEGHFLAGTVPAVSETLNADTSLADSPDFQAAVATLPESRTLTVWADLAGLAEAGSQLSGEGLPAELQGMRSVAGSVDAVPEGIRMDAVTAFDGEIPASYRSLIDTPSWISQLPADTLAFFTLTSVAEMWRSFEPVLDQFSSPGATRAELEAQAGFPLIDELILRLDRPSEVAVIERPGALTGLVGAPLGFAVSLGTSQPAEVSAAVEHLVGSAIEMGLLVTEEGGLYRIDEGQLGLTFGVVENRLLVTDLGSPDELAASPTLAEDPDLLRAANALGASPEDVIVYFDLEGMVTLFAGGTNPIQGVGPAVATASGEGSMLRAGGILLVEDPDPSS